MASAATAAPPLDRFSLAAPFNVERGSHGHRGGARPTKSEAFGSTTVSVSTGCTRILPELDDTMLLPGLPEDQQGAPDPDATAMLLPVLPESPPEEPGIEAAPPTALVPAAALPCPLATPPPAEEGSQE